MPSRPIAKRLELTGRRALRAALRRALPAPPPSADPVASEVARVLVIRQDNRIGNLVMLTPLLEAIRVAWPGAAVDVLTSDAFPEVFENLPGLHRVIAAPKKAFISNPIRFLSFFRALRRTRYDVVFDASHMHEFSLSSGAAARLTGAPVRIGYRRGDAETWLTRLVDLAPDGTHEMEIHLRLLRAVAPEAALPGATSLAPRWTITAEEAERAAERWRGFGCAPESAVAIFLGGRGAKKWPAAKFVEVAAGLRDRTPVFFGGPGEATDLDALRTTPGRVVAPPMALREFAATIARCAAVVSADTGPMHVAVAAGARTVEIFTNSEPERYGYAHLPGHAVVGRKGVDVSVAEVLAAFDSVLSMPAQERA